MKILIITGYYPPYAPASGTRVIKLAKFLLDAGHDVRVLSARNPELPPLLKSEIPDERVVFSGFTDLSAIPGECFGRLKRLLFRREAEPVTADQGEAEKPAVEQAPRSRGFTDRLTEFYEKLSKIPDAYIGWYPHAVRRGRELFATWQPDILYATAPPHTALLVASRLARIAKRPWIAEFRDLWVRHPYYSAPPWRAAIDRWLETRTLKSVAGYVTVTASWTALLEDLTGKPTLLAMNGFDPADFEERRKAVRPSGDGPLTLLYGGALYGNKRDPSPLFEALRSMGEEAKDIRVDFYVLERSELERLVASYGVGQSVRVHAGVPQSEMLDLEAAVDALLLLRWDDPGEESVIAGKVFEYIGAGRPILSVGSVKGEVATIIRDNGFGVVTKDPAEIAETLRSWLAVKRREGRLPGLDAERRLKFDRVIQFAKVEGFLDSLSARDG